MVEHAVLLDLATRFTRQHPLHAVELAGWLSWALPRNIDPTAPSTPVITAFVTDTGWTGGGVRVWRRWCQTHSALTHI